MEQFLFQFQSTLVVLLLTTGVVLRKNKNLHVRIMSTAIVWDLILILQIEISRGAIEKASQVIKNPLILNTHVCFAISTVVFYAVMIYSGRRILKGEKALKNRHKKFGAITYTLRMLTYITSYFVV